MSLIVAMPLQLSDAASVTPLKFFVSLFDFFAYAQAKKNNVCGAACKLQWWHLVDAACVDLRCGISPQEKEVCDNGIRGVCARGKIKKQSTCVTTASTDAASSHSWRSAALPLELSDAASVTPPKLFIYLFI